MSTYTVTLLGKYLCYALLALAVDLVWGYCGILSLGHGAFFALGCLIAAYNWLNARATQRKHTAPVATPDDAVAEA